MPLPENFSEWEHLQSQIERTHNKAVRQFFKNQSDLDISTPKSSLKHACTIKDNDSAIQTLLRLWLFEVTAGNLQAAMPVILGTPLEEHDRLYKYKPRLRLVFTKDYDPEEDDLYYHRYKSEITFRLVDEESDTISRAKAELLARNIKLAFTTPLFTWEKGWYKYTYQDHSKGYDLRLFVRNKLAGEQVTKKILEIQNHTFDDDFHQYIEHSRSYPTIPGTHRVYGQTIKKPRIRPRVDVKFRYAQLQIWGKKVPVNLVDTGQRFRQCIERV